MAGKVVVSTLNNDTGVLATQNGMTGIAKAWVRFNGSTSVIAGSFNVSSITRNTTGGYTVNFTTAMANADYAATAIDNGQWSGSAHVVPYINDGVQDFGGYNPAAPSTTAFNITCANPTNGGSKADPLIVMAIVMAS